MTLTIGALAFDDMDQIDLTGPFEVLSRLSDSRFRIFGVRPGPITDVMGLRIGTDGDIGDAPQLDLLVVPGGPGQENLMHDERLLSWLRERTAHAECVLSVCTGALLLGAAGLLRGRRATTHWASMEFLPYYGAEVVNERVVNDGSYVFTGGVTAGIDGALAVAARLRGDAEAEAIQLALQYAPEPPFDSGTPASAPPEVLASARAAGAALRERRLDTAEKYASRQEHHGR